MRAANPASGLVFLLLALPVLGQVPNVPPPGEASRPQEQLDVLVKDYHDARARFFEEVRSTNDDGEIKKALGRYLAEIHRTAKEAMGLARAHATEPVAVDSLRFVVRVGFAGQMGGPRRDPLAAEALAILRRDHTRAAKMGEFCEEILLSPHDPVAESLIREVLERHPSRDDRGLACHALAALRRYQAQEIRWLRGKPEDRKSYEDQFGDALGCFETIWGKGLMAEFLKNDPKVLDAEADSLLGHVIADFGNIPHAFGLKQGTLADLAEAELFEHHGLAIGKVAPEVVGRDHEGKEFKLSDYRGRVVMLTFSGNWCGPCRAIYPEERDLVERFKGKPFVLLSVNTDEEVGTLRKSILSREVTWRCWWDGRTGPITQRWGVMQFPAIFLLDGAGVIRARPRPQSRALAKAVESLLEENGSKPTP